jgi:ankyrin repeat protein
MVALAYGVLENKKRFDDATYVTDGKVFESSRYHDAIKLLLNAGCKPNPELKSAIPAWLFSEEPRLDYPGALLVELGALKLVAELLRHGSRLQTTESSSMTHLVVKSKCTNIVKYMPFYKCAINTYDGSGYTPLHRCVLHSMDEILELLLESDADPNTPALSGSSALLMAAAWKRIECVVALLKYKADPDWDTSLLLEDPWAPKQADILQLVQTTSQPSGHRQGPRNRGSPLSQRDKDGKTPLHIAYSATYRNPNGFLR